MMLSKEAVAQEEQVTNTKHTQKSRLQKIISNLKGEKDKRQENKPVKQEMSTPRMDSDNSSVFSSKTLVDPKPIADMTLEERTQAIKELMKKQRVGQKVEVTNQLEWIAANLVQPPVVGYPRV